MKKQILHIAVIGTLLVGGTSCEDFLDVKPEGVLLEGEAISNQADIERVLNSIYDVTANVYNGRMQAWGTLLGDNVARPRTSTFMQEVYGRNTNIFNSDVSAVYLDAYRTVYRANWLIENIDLVDVEANRRREILDEARYLRALMHFELVRYFGQPYGYTTDNSHLGIVIKTRTERELIPRNTVAEVYDFVISELKDVTKRLPTSNGVYATKYAAQGTLADVYFQMNSFATAAAYADSVIESGSYSMINTFDRYESGTNTEIVFGGRSYPSTNDNRGGSFSGFYRWDNVANPNPEFTMSQDFYDLVASNPDDLRDSIWMAVLNENAPNQLVVQSKFNYDFMDVPIVHLTKLKLIRAEALAMTGSDLPTAIQDINDIRTRAYGGTTQNLDGSESVSEILTAVRYERRVELMCEGDRGHELKRLGVLGEINTIRGADWDCPGQVLQFPSVERSNVFVLNDEGGC
ncbi:MAG: RagB/SusD family nutrient uptake outer membrane protein [Bacteroidetes bacterium]|uniref:RagB/SusD family nutrient uptake outer membrane protein n=1 Tax=Phaeocystidibacter marisrubri TaxID=1577780 RepID=A0A6L3ZCA2_9FLAO|nr:RagB/SusD family nutrient uptake outer membrane protein [Phaeocystidibacter marisrubri]KAB2815067.1 RagB/SusD family nutrient uptake outer membrane protein [Phaeocystidibacter marisrubri]TNE27685.1 MAG: RagB/SusD family nutrient uptake outer membrane protein [Bacteroidota bacterium]GGH70125.1 membrane protein [Phaeocystidibacter marisrubri]